MLSDIRLPGVYVEPLLPPARDGLPPMDVALFAGFAARGPCNVAIAVDSIAAFEACFGGSLSLARSADGSSVLNANLPATVRAFFGNGGRRCWVVRLARTVAHEARWFSYTGRAAFDADTAAANMFVVPGILSCLRGPNVGESRIRAAAISASSVGSWSDSMQVAARVEEMPFLAQNLADLTFGVSFDDPGGLSPGELIEFREVGDCVRRYAKTMRRDGDRMFALWCAAVERPVDPAAPPVTGTARIVGHEHTFAATLTGGANPCIEIDVESRQLQPGKWLLFSDAANNPLWMQTERVDQRKAFGAAWKQSPNALPAGDFSARRLMIDLAARLGGREEIMSALNPGLTGDRSVHALTSDDSAYAAPSDRHARSRSPLCAGPVELAKVADAQTAVANAGFGEIAARFGTPAFTPADYNAVCHAWLPVGIGAAFDLAASANEPGRDPLQRDGLSRFDDSLFLDPSLAGASMGQLGSLIEQVRDVQEEALSGIHAGLDTPDETFGIPSMLAVPDAAQPGWELAGDAGLAGSPSAGAPDRADWYDHDGGCSAMVPPGEADALAKPDASRFLDCTTALITAPVLTGPVKADGKGRFTLSWSGGPPGAGFVLDEATSADFRGAVEIYRGPATQLALSRPKDGSYYYRLHAQKDGNVSAYSAIGVVVQASKYVATAADTALIRRLHLAMMRMAGGTADLFALLSMPQGFDAKAAAGYSAKLRSIADGSGGTGTLGRNEERALSYAALYHPWSWYSTRRPDRGSIAALGLCSPEGFVAGQMAASANTRGAWIAPANDLLDDMVGLSPILPEASHLALYNQRVNLVRRDPQGFLLLDADTLSNEPEWQQINVRRLMILLRRLALQRGRTYVFEPNGDVMRRAVERDLTFALDGMQRRGAFAGKTSAQSFRVAVARNANDVEQGRMAFEIGVAPSQPMRFLNIRLVQRGARLSVAEEAA